MGDELPEWAGTANCVARVHCFFCMGTHEGALTWRERAAHTHRLPPEGTCPFWRKWEEIVEEREERIRERPARMAAAIDSAWDPLFSVVRRLLSEREFIEVLRQLIDTNAFGPNEEAAMEIAERIAERRGIDLSSLAP